MVFRFPAEPVEQLPSEIQGRPIGSTEEARVAVALYRLDIPFQYQVDFFGGRRLRGGMVLDFMAYTPFPVPIMVQGEYWHKGEQAAEDSYNIARLAQVIPGIGQVVELFGKDLGSIDEAVQAVRKALLI